MPEISEHITHEDVLKAVDKIERENIQGSSQRYEVVIKGKRFPPPLVCQYADFFANGEQKLLDSVRVGVGTKCFKTLKKLGFEVVEKVVDDKSSLKQPEMKVSVLRSIHAGDHIGENNKVLVVKKVTQDSIQIVMPADKNGQSPIRHIPTELIEKLMNALISEEITIQDILTKYRTDKGLPHLFDELKLDFDKYILGYDSTIQKVCAHILKKPVYGLKGLKTPAVLNSKPLYKSFILLAGISGTGKSRFVRKQAEVWQGVDNFELVSVRPDWHEPSDLLGYVLRLGEKPQLITTPVIKFMVKAWLVALSSGVQLRFEADKGICAQIDLENLPAAFWLCLDEMNLAPVEQYFADYLSVLETREWEGSRYYCQPLIKADFFGGVAEKEVKKALGLDDSQESEQLWQVIAAQGLPIPFNLVVAGTVNMDETTHGFSRKVIDRALSLDFGEFFPNDFRDFFEPTTQFKTLSYPILSQATLENVGEHAHSTVAFLNAMNLVLKGSLFELAYRALNECLLAVACEQPETPQHLQAVWDDFLMMKLLPRIEGDSDKLQSLFDAEKSLLDEMVDALKVQLSDIWEGKNRPDLLRENLNQSELKIACRSRKKIEHMQRQFENGFTHFWP